MLLLCIARGKKQEMNGIFARKFMGACQCRLLFRGMLGRERKGGRFITCAQNEVDCSHMLEWVALKFNAFKLLKICLLIMKNIQHLILGFFPYSRGEFK